MNLSLRGWAVAPAILTCLLADVSSAQQAQLIVSLSGDDQLASGSVRDQDLVWHGGETDARVLWPSETLSALWGQGTGSLHVVPGDVDAVHDPGSALPGGGMYFSLVADQGGFQDGDVLQVVDGSVVEVFDEEDLKLALGSTDGNIDVDALHLEEDGTWLLSFAEDEGSAVLSGDTPGIVADGAVVRWDAANGTIELVHTESDIGAFVAQALGSLAAPGDLKGIARHPVDGELLFSVQSPSAHDGSVFHAAAGGALLAGHEESDFGFAGSGELDALTVARSTWPTLQVSEPTPQPGGTLAITLSDAAPGSAWVLLLSGEVGPSWFDVEGWGGLALHEDATFAAALKLFPLLVATADGQGTATWIHPLPASVMPGDLMLQAFDLGAGQEGSNPVVVEVGQ